MEGLELRRLEDHKNLKNLARDRVDSVIDSILWNTGGFLGDNMPPTGVKIQLMRIKAQQKSPKTIHALINCPTVVI